MKNTKKELRFFTISDFVEEQNYLREKQKEGWKFQKVVMPGIYFFEKCVPEDIIYQLDYNEEGIRDHEAYVQMFRDCGWEYVLDFAGYSYFRKPASEMSQNENGIFCDDASRLELMQRIFRGKIVPMLILFIIFFSQAVLWTGNCSSFIVRSFFILYAIIVTAYIYVFIRFLVSYLKFRRKANH